MHQFGWSLFSNQEVAVMMFRFQVGDFVRGVRTERTAQRVVCITVLVRVAKAHDLNSNLIFQIVAELVGAI